MGTSTGMSERTRAAPAFRAPGSMGRNGEPPERPQRAQRSRAAPISVSSNDTAEVGLVRRPPHARGHVHGASIVSSWMDARLILRFARLVSPGVPRGSIQRAQSIPKGAAAVWRRAKEGEAMPPNGHLPAARALWSRADQVSPPSSRAG